MGWLRAAENKYNQLLFTQILLFLITPIRENSRFADLISSLLFMTIITITMRTLGLRRQLVALHQGIAVFLFILLIIPSINPISEETNLSLSMIGTMGFSIYLGLPILSISRDLFRRERVDADTIKGGICVYILIGVFWGFLYTLIIVFDPDAYSQRLSSFNQYIYFSFTTLTTLGYGDVTPVNLYAKNLAILEALVGQLYPAIFIARLVSLYDRDRPDRRSRE